MTLKTNGDILIELLELHGRVVLDVGCGDGALARIMARHGAHVTGLETSPRQLEKARAAERVADEHFLSGIAQSLPVGDGTVDIVVFSNSLHHVPPHDQPHALAEAARVLKPAGILYVSEPLPEGSFFALTRMIDDETEVRAKALQALRAASQLGLVEEKELVHVQPVRQREYSVFRERMLAIDAQRAAAVMAKDLELSEAFHRLGIPAVEGGWFFEQPTRINILRRHR